MAPVNESSHSAGLLPDEKGRKEGSARTLAGIPGTMIDAGGQRQRPAMLTRDFAVVLTPSQYEFVTLASSISNEIVRTPFALRSSIPEVM